jgi:hypothetical protein
MERYYMGQKFLLNGESPTYILCQVGYGVYALIGTINWNRFSEPVKLGDYPLSMSDISLLAPGYDIEPIW